MTAGRELERDRLRADRLTREAGQYRDARKRVREMYEGGGRNVANIAVRRALLLRPAAGRPWSPARRLLLRGGAALGLYLTALLEAQSRRPPGRSVIKNTRPITSTAARVGWAQLLPHAPDEEANLRQVQRTLIALERARLIDLKPRGTRNRYERFTLLRESGTSTGNRYTIPTSGKGTTFRIPKEFFLNGWVHVLSAAEVVLLMVMLDLRQRLGSGPVYLADSRKVEYCLSAEVYERHSALAGFGLLKRLTDPSRRADGTFIRWSGKAGHPWRFLVRPNQLERDAHAVVVTALRKRAGS